MAAAAPDSGLCCHLHSRPPPTGEYLDAAFLTKLMCVGRELHDFLTLPAQVGGGLLNGCGCAHQCGRVSPPGCTQQAGCAHVAAHGGVGGCRVLRHVARLVQSRHAALYLVRLQDILIAMGK
jgi:hypothetical protein